MEQELRDALRRKPAPEGFAARVGERAAERHSFASRLPARWAIAAALAVVTLSGTWTYREVEHRRGEEAKERTLSALRIASEKVQLARHRIHKVSSGENQ